MNSRGIAGIVVIVVGLLVALYIIVSVLSGFGNVIGATYKYFLPTAFVVGVIAPKISMYILILCGGYIDFFKKLMGVEESLYFTDVFFILGVPPVLLLGMCCGVLAGIAQGKVALDKRLVLLFALATVFVTLFSFAALARTGANLGTLKELSNSAAFYGLIFALPALFPKLEDVYRLLRFFVFAMIPAAFHGLYHSQFGLLAFEEHYMLSGLSMNTDYIYSGEGIYGPFASQGALSGTMTIAATICAFVIMTPRHMLRGIRFPGRWLCVILVILFMITAILSLKRFPIVVLPFTLIGFFLIRNKFGTAFAYVGALSSVIILVASSDYLAARLPQWQQSIDSVVDRRDSAGAQSKLFRLRTLNTRLEDFNYLKQPENWQPFGVQWFKETAETGDQGVHSLVVKIFLRFGWVPIVGVIMVMIPFVGFLHSRLVRRIKTLQQRTFVFLTSLAVSMFLTAGLGAAFFATFPIPLIFGMCLAMAVTTGVLPPRTREVSVPEDTVQPVDSTAPTVRPLPGRA